jgi:hypothetical protein
MHPALHSWREELPDRLVRLLAYVGGLLTLSIGAAQFFQPIPVKEAITPVQRQKWIEIERPFPAFTLAIPEAAGEPSTYTILRHGTGFQAGSGRKDILGLGEPDGVSPYLRVEVYRPGDELAAFLPAGRILKESADALGPIDMTLMADPLPSKFGPLTVASFSTSTGPTRRCLAFVRTYDDPRLQLSGWFCQGGSLVRQSTLACALERLTLLSAGSDPKVGALFAKAELNRDFCGQREPLLAATPKYRVLWKALSERSDPRHAAR